MTSDQFIHKSINNYISGPKWDLRFLLVNAWSVSSVTQLCPTLRKPHGLQHARVPCPSPTHRAYSNSCLLSRWCRPTISSSVDPFASHLQSFLASGSFQMSQLFASGGQIIGVSASASVLPMNIQDWFPLGWTGLTSLQSNSRVWMWELDYKESWTLKNWCFWTVVLEKTLESPLVCKEIKPSQS